MEREADARTRTGDPFITSEVLYQLSYVGERLRVAILTPAVSPATGFKEEALADLLP